MAEAGLQGSKAGRFQLGKERSGRLGQMQLRVGSTHVSPYDTVSCILEGGGLETVGINGGGAAHFSACRENCQDDRKPMPFLMTRR